MSLTPSTTKTHDALVRALAGKSGQSLSAAEIKQLVEEQVPELGKDSQWLHPTDHCDNHTIKGACRCSNTEDAPLSLVSRGLFLIR
jgi:hypothetical protein